eukprot:COSAG03_NODE_11550_length_587_cov_0.790984_1_plen_81_part_01
MTIVESAAFGVPTLTHSGALSIGATDLLPETARFEADMTDVEGAAGALAALVRCADHPHHSISIATGTRHTAMCACVCVRA